MNNFDRDKERALSGVDLSRKGSIDEKIHALVALLNTSTDFFTTSSCSGRIIIFDDSVSRLYVYMYNVCTADALTNFLSSFKITMWSPLYYKCIFYSIGMVT